jgi:dipeptide transport system permease protein
MADADHLVVASLQDLAQEARAFQRQRLERQIALAEIGRDYVTASRVAGAGVGRLMFITVLPNCMAPIIVQAALSFSSAILEAAALGFLGLGAQPPTPSWGAMMSSGAAQLFTAPWIILLPGLALTMTVIAINLFGDALIAALDIRTKLRDA